MYKILILITFTGFASPSSGQTKYFNGTVKELHFQTPNKTRPLEGVNVILKSPCAQHQRTSTGGKFSFVSNKQQTCLLDIEYPGYEVVDLDALKSISWDSDVSKEPAHILLSRTGIVERITDEFYNQVNLRLQKVNQRKLDSLKSLYKDNLELYKKNNLELQENLISLQSQAKSFAKIFATTDFDSLNTNYYNAFKHFKLGNLDSCDFYLNDTFLENEEKMISHQKKVAAGAYIMKAQIHSGETQKIENYYKKAIGIDYKYYTLEAYSNFLLQQQRYKDATPYLEQKLTLLNEPISPKDTIYTLYQLSKVFSRPLHTDKRKSHYYDSIILSKANLIENGSDKLLQTILAMTYYSLSYHYSDLRLQTKDNIYELKAIEALHKTIYYYKKFDLGNYEDTNIWKVDLSELYYDIGLTYEEILSNKDSAALYYLKSVAYAREEFFSKPNERQLNILFERYDDFCWSESFSKAEKVKFLKEEKQRIKSKMNIAANSKQEIVEELDSYMKEIKENGDPSMKMERIFRQMLSN